MRLASKIGIVTAAASGMGRAGALRFAREGAQVVEPQSRALSAALKDAYCRSLSCIPLRDHEAQC